MTFDEYQKLALKTDITKKHSGGILSIRFMDKVLGLVGESGEFAERLKKILRDKNAQMDEVDKQALIKELGDVLWYTAVLAHYLDTSFEVVASGNISKLAKRHKAGKLGGSGDNR